MARTEQRSERYRVNDLIIDADIPRIIRDGDPVDLPKPCVDLLLALVRAAPNPVDEATLGAQISSNGRTDSHALRQRLDHLRSALGDNPHSPRYVGQVGDNGYLLLPPVVALSEQRPSTLLGEFTRRRVVQSALLYVAIAWSITEITTFLIDAIPVFPDWSRTLMAVLFLTGFPVAMFLAWRFDIEPGGIRRVQPLTRQGRATILVAILLLVVSTAGLFYLLYPRVKDSSRALVEAPFDPPPKSIAVMPLLNVGDDPSNAAFAEGIPDTVLHKLANIKELVVIARTSSFAFQDAGVEATTIGRELNARFLLEGSVQRVGKRLRIITQLIDTVDGSHIWSLEKDVVVEDVFAVQDEIVLEISRALELTLRDEQRQRLLSHGTTSVPAYLAFLRGTYATNSRSIDRAYEAQELFQQALELDPEYARAWLGLARSVDLLIVLRELPADSGVRELRSHISRALDIDPSLGEAYAMMADALGTESENWYATPEVHRLLDRAFQLSPNDPKVLRSRAMWSCPFVSADKACHQAKDQALREVIKRDPEDPNLYLDLAWTMSALNRADEAYELMREAIRRDPDFLRGYQALAYLYWGGRRFDWVKAAACLREAIDRDPGNLGPRFSLAYVYLDAGMTDAAERIAVSILELDQSAKQVESFRHELRRREGIIEVETSEATPAVIEKLEADLIRFNERQRRYEDGLVRNRRAAGIALELSRLHRSAGNQQRSDELITSARSYFEREIAGDSELRFANSRLFAQTLLMMGEAEAALRELERVPGGHLAGAWEISSDPAFAPLQDHPRFKAVVADIEERIGAFRRELEHLGDDLPPCVPGRRKFKTRLASQ